MDSVRQAAALVDKGCSEQEGGNADASASGGFAIGESPVELARAGASALPWLRAYNERVRTGKGPVVNDPFAFDSSDESFAETGLADMPVGLISVPAMDCELPLYLGSTRRNMALGAAVVAGTSAPIGETDSNCVIAGHRGYSGALFFREMENMQVGDTVTLSTLWGTFMYRAVEFRVVRPAEVGAVAVQRGRDLLTLSTCHPYPHNSHRYLAICERVLSDQGEAASEQDAAGFASRLGLGFFRTGEGMISDDGSLNMLFLEHVGRLLGRVLLIAVLIRAATKVFFLLRHGLVRSRTRHL